MSVDAVPHLADRQEIVEATRRLSWLIDRRAWDDILELLDDTVDLDYASVGAPPAPATPRADVVAMWRRLLSGLDMTQHLTGNHVVDDVASDHGREAGCLAAFQATHVLVNPLGGSSWTVWGHYRYRLRRSADRWRIAGITVTAEHAAGNRDVMALAEATGSAAP